MNSKFIPSQTGPCYKGAGIISNTKDSFLIYTSLVSQHRPSNMLDYYLSPVRLWKH